MIGYHYTSLDNWYKIQCDGLVPYAITKPGFVYAFGSDDITGVWVWKYKLEGLSHIGSILYQMTTKNTTSVVLIELEYYKRDIKYFTYRGNVKLTHSGNIGNLVYHDGSEEAVILRRTIRPSRLKVIKIYNLYEAFNEKNKG